MVQFWGVEQVSLLEVILKKKNDEGCDDFTKDDLKCFHTEQFYVSTR